jgi:hypothetical protein
MIIMNQLKATISIFAIEYIMEQYKYANEMDEELSAAPSKSISQNVQVRDT